MPVYSMTGYASVVQPESGLCVELRSVNSRFLDLSFKFADDMRHLEPAFKDALTGAFRRGKVELRLTLQNDRSGEAKDPTSQQLQHLASLERAVRAQLPHASGITVAEALAWCRQARSYSAQPSEQASSALQTMDALTRCIEALRESRQREGAKLAGLLQTSVSQLRALSAQAAPLIPAVIKRQQERFLLRWNEAIGVVGAAQPISGSALQERALTEAAAFAIRIDVAEELARLNAHLDEIDRLLLDGGELGKRLDFLIQELHREANTLGSKSAALELTTISVEMRVLIEQMREQVQNLE